MHLVTFQHLMVLCSIKLKTLSITAVKSWYIFAVIILWPRLIKTTSSQILMLIARIYLPVLTSCQTLPDSCITFLSNYYFCICPSVISCFTLSLSLLFPHLSPLPLPRFSAACLAQSYFLLVFLICGMRGWNFIWLHGAAKSH